MESNQLVDLETVRAAYRSITENGPIHVLFSLLNNEHYAAAKDIAGILEEQMSLANFMSRINPSIIKTTDEEQTFPDPSVLMITISKQIQALTEAVGRLAAPESKEGTNE